MKIHEIHFSPTGGTAKVASIIAGTLADETVAIDLTDRQTDFHAINFTSNDIVMLSVPSYSGRVPAPAVERIAAMHGNGARAILVCVYGNRAYEDTLIELQDTARQAGFKIIAAVAAIAEHSIAHRYATGRPDHTDNVQLTGFAEQIKNKINNGDLSDPQLPGNRPYRKAGNAGIVPQASKTCVKCGVCAYKCPVGAISENDPSKVDKKLCISCMRCISVCPHHARHANRIMLALVNRMLKKVCSDRKTCELYI